jgi:hypothetical protein
MLLLYILQQNSATKHVYFSDINFHIKCHEAIPDSTMFERRGEQYDDRECRSVEWERAVTETEPMTVLSLF